MPLFGVPLLFTAQRSLVDIEKCIAGDIYYFVTYSIEALQGVVVSILFCYMNTEVNKSVHIFFNLKTYQKCFFNILGTHGN